MSHTLSRRSFVTSATAVTGSLIAAELCAAVPPKETGLPSEGLLAGRPGFQARTVMPLPHDEIPGFLSRAQLASRHAEYVRQVEQLAETERQLKDANLDASRYGELRRTQVRAANGVLLHELYFGNLAPAKVAVPRYVDRHMTEHMGSMDAWAADFTRCALGARAWALLVYDPYDDRWHDVMMDGDDTGMWIGANPLVVCDVSEHAIGNDHGGRDAYVQQFLDHIDWNEVATRYKTVDRM